MLKVEKNSRQIPSVKSYTANKKYNDLIYSLLQERSYLDNVGGINYRFVDKKDFSFVSLGQQLNLSRQKASEKFKNLIELGLLIEDPENRRYRLQPLEKDICSLVPYETLRKINNALSHYAISIYVYLLSCYIANGEKPYMVTMMRLKNFIGISANTSSNNCIITDILDILQLIGLIKFSVEYDGEKKHIWINGVANRI